jgi:plasmid maintenance system killer protein
VLGDDQRLQASERLELLFNLFVRVRGAFTAIAMTIMKAQGQYSIRINDQWRICFEWPHGASGPINVEIVDYH